MRAPRAAAAPAPAAAAPAPTILAVMDHPALFGPFFTGPSWTAWRTFLAVMFGLPLTAEQAAIYRACTGRDAAPSQAFAEAWLIVGRRGGKSRVLALIAVFLAVFLDWLPFLAPGERGTIIVLAVDRKQARGILRYAKAMLTSVPALASLVSGETADSIDLTNRITIEVGTASFRTVRGYTIVAALLDEIAYFRSDETNANPDSEILDALRPAMATIPNAMLLAASSPYARKGAMWDAYKSDYGQDGSDVLVWKADTRTMNPAVPQRVIDKAYVKDPAAAAAEFGAEFRTDIEGFVSREVVEAATPPGRHELPYRSGVRYVAFVDPSGGSADSMTLAVAHKEGATAVLDAVREVRPPFGPDSVCQDFAALLKSYRLRSVTGDRYAGEWPRERFRVHGITYQLAEKPKSDLYRDMLPILNSGQVELLDLPRLSAQLIGLERRTARGGRDSIDHAPGGHDDVANCVAGVLSLVTTGSKVIIFTRAQIARM